MNTTRNHLLIIAALILFIYSCKPNLTPQALYGKWKYLKVESPNSNPPDSVKSSELEQAKPYILFAKNDSMQILWDGKVLSHGTFKVEGSNIQIKEILPDGTTRNFPFWVSKITEKDLIFETKGEDGSRVTAVKQ
jgi:hypothetical protein